MSAAQVPMGGVRAEKRRKNRKIIHWILTAAFIVVTILFAVFRFEAVALRTWTALKDAFRSIVNFGIEFFGAPGIIETTVQDFPAEQMEALLPLTVEELVTLARRFWSLLTNEANVRAYFAAVQDFLYDVAWYMLPVMMLCGALALVVWLSYKKIDTGRGDTKPLQVFKKIKRATYNKAKRAVKRYVEFFKDEKRVKWLTWTFALLWAYNLNVLTIALEAVAYVFYLSITQDLANIAVQLTKLIVDLSVPVFFFPLWLWVIVGYIVFHKIRLKVGKKLRDYYVAQTEAFLDKHPGALFLVGKQRSGKTTLLTMFKVLYERVFRKAAKKRLRARDRQFPHFDWKGIVQVIKHGRESGAFVIFDDVARFARRLEVICEENLYDKYRESMLEYYGYDVNELRTYVEEGGRMAYSNGISESSLFLAIERYGQLFYIYSQDSALDISNYPIRDDFTFADHGCFPVFDGDLYRKVKESKENTKRSHIVNYDWFRLGEVFDEDSADDVAIEYGIGVQTEFAKDRKNKATKSFSIKKRKANQNNDFFELDTKMRSQIATIDYFNFWVWLFDDQRAGSLGADNKDMTTECLIKERSADKLFLPCFIFEELIHGVVLSIYDRIKDFIESRKNKNTLLMYLLDSLLAPFFQFFDRMKAQYSMNKITIKTTDGADGEMLGERETVYDVHAITHADRFTTDNARPFYNMKYAKATRSLHGTPTYAGEYPTIEEYEFQNSYRVDDMTTAAMNREERRQAKKQAKTPENEADKEEQGDGAESANTP